MAKSFTLQQLADLTESTLVGDPSAIITSFASLEEATGKDISFFAEPKFDHQRYQQALQNTNAGALFVPSTTPRIPGKNLLLHPSPSLAFQKILELFQDQSASAFQGIHPSAIIDPSAKIGENVTIGPFTVIDKNTRIGSNTTIGPHCTIGHGTIIGDQCTLYANVTIRENCTLHHNITIQPGAVIGSCGFGYHTDERGQHHPLKQVGTVVIEDNVDIGANTTIDRARFQETRIKSGTKIDNLVQIAHGVQVGEHNIIVSQTGIAGSTKTGKHVILGGQVAVNGHIELADQVVITSRSGVSKSLTKPGKYGGVPVQPLQEYNRNSVQLRNIDKYIKKIKELEKRLEDC